MRSRSMVARAKGESKRAVVHGAVLAALLAFAATAAAECRMSLPHEAPQAVCTPRVAAAYDFAFCSVSYYIGSLSAKPFPNGNGESEAESMRMASNAYAQVSLALSDAEKVKVNIDLAKRYFEDLRAHRDKVTPMLEQIGRKCYAINEHHNAVLEEVAQEIRARRR